VSTVNPPIQPWALDRLAARCGVGNARDAVVIQCRALLADCDQLDGPVGLKPLLQRLDAVEDRRPLETAGRLTLTGRGWRITVRLGTNYRRARFTVAHEIAHILICKTLADEPDALRALQDREHWPQVERLCNLGAAELLMPSADFEMHTLRHSFRPSGLRELYNRYLVSWEPLLRRVCEIFGGSLIPFSRTRRHAAERMALRVLRPPAGRDVWLPTGLTSRYLVPDIVDRAVREGFAVTERLWVNIGGVRPRLAAAAVSLSAAATADVTAQPRLDGFEAPDESDTPFSVALFATPSADDRWWTAAGQ
jgi:hypothetical protein